MRICADKLTLRTCKPLFLTTLASARILGEPSASQASVCVQAVARRQAQAGNQLQQPMLDHIYGVQPVWTPPRLLRATFISLVGGFVAGAIIRCRDRSSCDADSSRHRLNTSLVRDGLFGGIHPVRFVKYQVGLSGSSAC